MRSRRKCPPLCVHGVFPDSVAPKRGQREEENEKRLQSLFGPRKSARLTPPRSGAPTAKRRRTQPGVSSLPTPPAAEEKKAPRGRAKQPAREKSSLWIDIPLRYIGDQKVVQKIQNFIRDCPQGKVLWLRGPPGIGKAAAVKTAVSRSQRCLKEFSAIECVKRSYVDTSVLPCLTNFSLGSAKFPVVLIRGVDAWSTLGPANAKHGGGGVRALLQLFEGHSKKRGQGQRSRKKAQRRRPLRHGPLIITDHNHYQRDGSEKFKKVAIVQYLKPPSKGDVQTIATKLKTRLPVGHPPVPPLRFYNEDVRKFLNNWQLGGFAATPASSQVARVRIHQDFFPFMKYVATKKWKVFSLNDTMSGSLARTLPDALLANWPKWGCRLSFSDVLSDADVLCPYGGGGAASDPDQSGGTIGGQDWAHWLLAHCQIQLPKSMEKKPPGCVGVQFPRLGNPMKQTRPAIDLCKNKPEMFGLKPWEISERLAMVPHRGSEAAQPGRVDQTQLVLATRFGFKDFDRDAERKQIAPVRARTCLPG